MELMSRHRNLTILVAVLFAQVVGLAVQVKRPTERGPTSLIRLWGVSLITPAENAVVHVQSWAGRIWRNYFYLRDVRRENERLQQENLRLRLEQVRMAQDAGQAHRLQALMKFKEQFISQTLAAQVIGSSGTETSRLIYIDKGERDGVKPDMAVISPAGIVGKVIRAFTGTAQVLEINDQSSGFGAMLEKSRLQGILRGTASGEMMVHYIMSDEKVEIGEMVVTSGGDRIFPKGLPIGRVVQVSPGPETFLNIRVKPAAQLDRLEEVLVILQVEEKQPDLTPVAPRRAADILAERLPSIPVKVSEPATGPQPASATRAGSDTGPGGVRTPVVGVNPVGSAKPTAVKPSPVGPKPPVATTRPLTPSPVVGPNVEGAKPLAPAGTASSTALGSTGLTTGTNVAPITTVMGQPARQANPKPVKPSPESPNPQTKENPR